jgi:hypothetical protein
MDVRRDARRASPSEGAKAMVDAEKRNCIGSKRFGIEPHEASVADFPKQPSQKDGLGRMCTVHWNEYTAGLARDAKARKAATVPTDGAVAESHAQEPTVDREPASRRKRASKAAPAGEEATASE